MTANRKLLSSHKPCCNAAAGVIPIAHDSGGPRQDIVGDSSSGTLSLGSRPGYLCGTLEQYAEAIVDILVMDQTARLRIADAARRCVYPSIDPVLSSCKFVWEGGLSVSRLMH